jgi:uncharacterized protein
VAVARTVRLGAPARATGRASPWRVARARSLLALGLLGTAGALVALAARVFTDLLWFEEVGQEEVFWTTLKWKLLAYAVVGLGSACVLILNFAIAERVMARSEAASPPARGAAVWPYRRLIYAAAAIAWGLISLELTPNGWWQQILLWVHRGDFGVTDPLFDRDVGFFVFSLPLYLQVTTWLLATLVVAASTAAAAYAIGGVLRTVEPRASRRVRRHLLVLGTLALLVIAWRLRLEQFRLELPSEGSTVAGAGYTDVHVNLPALRLLMALALIGAGICLYTVWRRPPLVPVAVLAALAAIAILGGGGVRAVVDRFDVQPQELSRERPYLDETIAATRRAYELDRIAVDQAPGGGSLSVKEIEHNRDTLRNVPLWDPAVLTPAMNDLQSIGRYYNFPSATIDRYAVEGVRRVMTVAARELNLQDLGKDFLTWANTRFAYTHGYGVVGALADEVADARYPEFAQRDFRDPRNPLGLEQPRIYFGERRGPDPPYVITPSNRGEVDEPAAGSEAPSYHYDGDGGIPLDPLRRAAFAVRFGDPDLLLSETVSAESRILLHRDVVERVESLAPFLRWGRDPQVAVIDGRVQYLLDGYTTSAWYPYSALVEMGDEKVNYVREAARATVDAYSGEVRIYAASPDDPILDAWQSAYPTLFLAGSEMPEEVRAHLRYPEQLFTVQEAAYSTFHATDATAFWNGADAWRPSHQLAGPAEFVGEIQFPDANGIDSGQRRAASERWRMRPAYLLARLPGEDRQRFLLTTSFTPAGRENLVSYLAGSIDRRGKPHLTALSLPRDELTPGPTQAARAILSSPEVTQRIQLLNKESRDLGEAAVNRTILGAPRLVPVADALVYVQPIYVTSGGSGVPRLQLVTAVANGRVGYGPDVISALRRAVRQRPPASGLR